MRSVSQSLKNDFQLFKTKGGGRGGVVKGVLNNVQETAELVKRDIPNEMMNYSDNGWYSMVLGQYMAVLSGTWWYWVILSWYCLILGGAGSV